MVSRVDLFVGALLLALCSGFAFGQNNPEDRMLMHKYKQACDEVRKGTFEERMLFCPTLRRQEQLIASYVQDQVSDVCKQIARECQQAGRGESRNRISYFSQLLGCSRYSEGCPVETDLAQRAKDSVGDINPIVEAIDAIERTGGRVPPALKLAVHAYIETRDLGRDIKASLQLVDIELRRFYANVELGCKEDPDFQDDPPPNACTARIDRQVYARAIDSVLNWQNSNSAVRDVARRVVARWDVDRLRHRARAVRMPPQR